MSCLPVPKLPIPDIPGLKLGIAFSLPTPQLPGLCCNIDIEARINAYIAAKIKQIALQKALGAAPPAAIMGVLATLTELISQVNAFIEAKVPQCPKE